DLHFVTHVELTQTPKHGRVSARAVQVSSNHGTAPVAWARTASTLPRPSGRLRFCYLFQTQRSNGLLAQHKLLHLATGRQGIGFDELKVARDLLAADLSSTVVA